MLVPRLLRAAYPASRAALVRQASSAVPTVTQPAPKPTSVTPQNAVFDEVTHTGQAFDAADYRNARFLHNPKTVNPNIAAHIVAEEPPIPVTDRIVACDGGHPALGHPVVYLNLDKPGIHVCGYCGKKYYNTHNTTPEMLATASVHIEV